MKKLYRSNQNKVWAGVIGGIGEFFNIDPVILRLIWVLVTIFTGVIPGVAAYIASCFIVPNKPVKFA